MVGVCIKHSHENYGGMLQAYATVSFLERHRIDYELVVYNRKKNLKELIKDTPRILNLVWLNSRYEGVQRRMSLKFHSEYSKNNSIRMKAFDEFKKYAFSRFSETYVGYPALKEGGKKYSAVITGSDQLWSPAGLPSNYYNLMFAPDNIPKISIASSFGVSEIPWYQKRRTKNFLERLEFVSMRENRGSEIVKELTGREVPTILDPVFYLTYEEWLERIPNKREFKEPYILAYFLGSNPEYRLAVEEFAKSKNIKIVALRHLDQYVKSDEKFGDFAPYDVDPRKFLNLIRNAEYVCTDSFHGTAFSIINKKNFVVFDRYKSGSSFSKNTRIDSICQNLSLEERRYTKGKKVTDILSVDIDYSEIEKKLKLHSFKTETYLNEILKKLK